MLIGEISVVLFKVENLMVRSQFLLAGLVLPDYRRRGVHRPHTEPLLVVMRLGVEVLGVAHEELIVGPDFQRAQATCGLAGPVAAVKQLLDHGWVLLFFVNRLV